MRQCIYCRKSLPLEAFKQRAPRKDRGNARYRMAWCKDCHRLYKRARLYGTTVPQLLGMLKRQDYKCAICSDQLPSTWHLDHDHDTHAIRGILCPGCNTGIGHLRDDPTLLRLAADYLEKEVMLRGY